MRRLDTHNADFDQQLKSLLAAAQVLSTAVLKTVQEIIYAVQQRGDQALLDYTNQFDKRSAAIGDLEITQAQQQAALDTIADDVHQALVYASDRITEYHHQQKQSSWQYQDQYGNILGQKITPLDRVGVYVPGGQASYPSSVLMNIIPAKVAGVDEIVMVVPAPQGELNDVVLAAAAIAKVDRMFAIGGAQAIAALAYGTDLVPKVDKIVGPGNIYVAGAKREVFGVVGIDMIAGPSEILIIADDKADPKWVAMDMFAQSEHDVDASAIVISDNSTLLDQVAQSIEQLLPHRKRKDIIESALKKRGALIKVADLSEAATIANTIAPEHLQLSVADPEVLCQQIRHAGAIFLGGQTTEALGDYCAGPSHVLPTSGTARFSSPLGIYDFQKRSSIIQCHPDSINELVKATMILAKAEGLEAHATSAEYRIKSELHHV